MKVYPAILLTLVLDLSDSNVPDFSRERDMCTSTRLQIHLFNVVAYTDQAHAPLPHGWRD